MSASGLTSLLLFLVGLGLGLVVLVVGILLIISYLAGWGALARQYRADPLADRAQCWRRNFSGAPRREEYRT